MASTSEVPAWLEGNNNNNNNNTTTNDIATNPDPSLKEVDIETPPVTKKNDDTVNIPSTEQSSKCSKVMKCIALSISALLFVLFIASSVVQDNDTDGSAILYLIFYALHAIVAGAYFFSHFMCQVRMSRFVTGLGSAMLIWSIGFIINSSIDYSRTTAADDITKAGGDIPNASNKEGIAYEIAGATLGAISALYHICMARKSSFTA
jgi:hypothetical protein